MAEAALRDLRRVSGLLRSGSAANPSPRGVADWVREIPSRIPREVADVSATVRGPDCPDISSAQELLLERVVMEGISNAAKHRAGGRVSILVEFGGEIVVTIVSGGVPERPAHRELDRGHGLRGLALAVTRCGGRVTTRRRSAGRFVLEVSLPR
jgi:signal transduction histidine kinase